jgi:phage anti-repressor protein
MATQPVGVTFSEELQTQMFGADKVDFPIDFDNVWVWLAYSRKDNGLAAMVAELDEHADYIKEVFLIIQGNLGTPASGRPSDKYYLSVDGFKVFCMAAGTQRGKEVRRYFVEVEKAYKELAANRAMEDVFADAPVVPPNREAAKIAAVLITNQSQKLRFPDALSEAEKQIEEKLTRIAKTRSTMSHNPALRDHLLAQLDAEIYALSSGRPTPQSTASLSDSTPRPERQYKTQVDHFARIVGNRKVISLHHIAAQLAAVGMPYDQSSEMMSAFAAKQGWKCIGLELTGAELTFKPVIATKSGCLTKLRFYTRESIVANPIEQYLPSVVATHQFQRQGYNLVDSRTLADALNKMYGLFPMVITTRYVSNTLKRWGWVQPTKTIGKDSPRLWVVSDVLANPEAPVKALTKVSRRGGASGQLDILTFAGAAPFVCSAKVLQNVIAGGHPETSLRQVANALMQVGFVQLKHRVSNASCDYGDYTAFTFYARSQALADTVSDSNFGYDYLLHEIVNTLLAAGQQFSSRVVAHLWNQHSDRPFEGTMRWATDNLKRLSYERVKSAKSCGPMWKRLEGGV